MDPDGMHLNFKPDVGERKSGFMTGVTFKF